MKKTKIYDAPAWKTFVRKPDPIRAKVFELGDQDGFVDAGGQVPYIRIHDNSRQLGAFEENVITIDENGLRRLVNKELFDSQHDCIDQ